MPFGNKRNRKHILGGETGDKHLLHTVVVDAIGGMDAGNDPFIGGETGTYTKEFFLPVQPSTGSVDWSGHSGHSGHGHLISALPHYCELPATGTMHATADAVTGSESYGETQNSVGLHGHYATLLDIYTLKPHCKTDDDHTGMKLALGAVVDESVKGTSSEVDVKSLLPLSSPWVNVSPCAYFSVPAVMDLKGEAETEVGSTELKSHLVETEPVKIVITALNAYEQKCSSHAECLSIDLADGEKLPIKPVFAVLKEIGTDPEISLPGNAGEPPDEAEKNVDSAVAFINHKVNISELIRCNKSDKLLDKIMILLTHKAKAAIE